MEENFHESIEPVKPDNVCINCSSPDVLAGYPNKLCANCRNSFIKFPIPLWVKLFGAGVLAAMVIAMIWLPQNFNAALDLQRAERAEAKLDYFTEQQYLEKALKIAPQSEEILLHLAIASFNNSDLRTLLSSTDALAGKKMDDTALVNQVNTIMEKTNSYVPDSAFNSAFAKYKNTFAPDTTYKNYIINHPGDIYPMYALATVYAGKEQYPAADSVLLKLLAVQPDYIPALNMMTMVKRELGQPDSSIKYCDELLNINHQNLYALSSKARTLIKSRKNTEGLAMAKTVYALDKKDGYNMSTLVLAYHFNNDLKKRDEMIALAKKDTASAEYLKYAQDVVSNKIKYQN